MDRKRCGRCRVGKSILEFSICLEAKDGLQRWCKNCKRIVYKRARIRAKRLPKPAPRHSGGHSPELIEKEGGE